MGWKGRSYSFNETLLLFVDLKQLVYKESQITGEDMKDRIRYAFQSVDESNNGKYW